MNNDTIEITEEERKQVEDEANQLNAETGCTCPIRATVVNDGTFAAKIETVIDYDRRFCPLHGVDID